MITSFIKRTSHNWTSNPYYRWGAKSGLEVVTVKNVPGLTRVWLVRTPRGKVVTMQMNARSSVTTHGIATTSCPAVAKRL